MLPNLIHPCNISIEQWSKSNTVVDPDFREPVQQAARLAVVVVQGQPKWTDKDKVTITKGGVVLTSVGYVLFRYADLSAKSLTLKPQDRIIKMGHITTDVYIMSFKPLGHYEDQDGASLVKAYFIDKAPSRLGE